MHPHGGAPGPGDRLCCDRLGRIGDSLPVRGTEWPGALRRGNLERTWRSRAACPARPEARRAGRTAPGVHLGGRRAPCGPRWLVHVRSADHPGNPSTDRCPGRPGAAAQPAELGNPGGGRSRASWCDTGGRVRHDLPCHAAPRSSNLSGTRTLDTRLGHPPLWVPRAQPCLLQPACRRIAGQAAGRTAARHLPPWKWLLRLRGAQEVVVSTRRWALLPWMG